MNKFMSLALLAGAFSAPVMAQDNYDSTADTRSMESETMSMDTSDRSSYFNGAYLGGTFALDSTANRDSNGISFDTNQDGSFTDAVRTSTGANAFSTGFCSGAANTASRTGGCGTDDDDYGYSVRFGVDRRLGNEGVVVAGILVEAAKSETRDFVSAFSTTPASYVISRNLDHSFAARGRLGVSPGDGRGLFYVTGGVGYGKLEHDFTTTNGANSFTQNNEDDYVLGGQVGGGAELYVARNLTLGLEYLYQSFDDSDYSVAVGRGSAAANNPFLLASGGTNLRPASTDYNLHSFRVGVNLRF